MLNERNASAIVAVSNLERARRFYRDTLELELVSESSGVMVFRSGSTQLSVYESKFAGTNLANAVTWSMHGDLRDVVSSLAAKGVIFEHYEDLPGLTVRGDVHEAGAALLAWFKDPDGNILHLVEGM